jgi:hypothetical protein
MTELGDNDLHPGSVVIFAALKLFDDSTLIPASVSEAVLISSCVTDLIAATFQVGSIRLRCWNVGIVLQLRIVSWNSPALLRMIRLDGGGRVSLGMA